MKWNSDEWYRVYIRTDLYKNRRMCYICSIVVSPFVIFFCVSHKVIFSTQFWCGRVITQRRKHFNVIKFYGSKYNWKFKKGTKRAFKLNFISNFRQLPKGIVFIAIYFHLHEYFAVPKIFHVLLESKLAQQTQSLKWFFYRIKSIAKENLSRRNLKSSQKA